MNHVSLTGRITHHPEVKTTNNDISVCSFSLAVKRPKTKDTTDFINCTAWRQGAEFLGKFAKKGDMIGVSGTLTSHNYEDKNGNKRTAWEVQADDVEILTSKAERAAEEPEAAETAEPKEAFEEVSEAEYDLPF